MKFSTTYKKVENGLALSLTVLMVLFPIILAISEIFFKYSIPGSDSFLINLVFVFSCVAGVLTSREGKQLSISTFVDWLPKKGQFVTALIKVFASTAILVSLFFSASSQFVLELINEEIAYVWGIPFFVFSLALVLMYFVMIWRELANKKTWIAGVLGIIVGFFISTESISNVVYDFAPNFSEWCINFANSFWFPSAFFSQTVLIVIFILLAICGVPLFIVLSGIAYVCFSAGGGYVQVLAQETYNGLTDKSIVAIPLFTLAGFFLASGSTGKRLINVVQSAVGSIRGGAAIAAVLVAAFFTTFTGASGVTILALGGLLSLILQGNGYSEDSSQALVTASGSIGLLFPPSMAIIIYATTNYFPMSNAGFDVFDLFKGAIIPGLLLCISMIVIGVIQDKNINRPKFNIKKLGLSLKESIWELALPIFIIIFYFLGFLSLTQTAAFADLYSFVIIVFIRKDIKLKDIPAIVIKSIPVAGGVLVIVGAARGLLYYFIDSGLPDTMLQFVQSIVHSKYIFLILLNVFLLIVGCLMDMYSAILVVSPLIIPIAEYFGIHQIHIAVIFLTNMALGFLTPPVGMNLFIATYTFDKPLLQICKKILPYLAIQFVILLLITYVPWFTTVLL